MRTFQGKPERHRTERDPLHDSLRYIRTHSLPRVWTSCKPAETSRILLCFASLARKSHPLTRGPPQADTEKAGPGLDEGLRLNLPQASVGIPTGSRRKPRSGENARKRPLVVRGASCPGGLWALACRSLPWVYLPFHFSGPRVNAMRLKTVSKPDGRGPRRASRPLWSPPSSQGPERGLAQPWTAHRD